jgi:acyl carrier protein
MVEAADVQDGIEEWPIALLARCSGLEPGRISSDSRLVQDLQLDGDDATDALLEISKRYGMEFAGFDPSLYFRPEPNLFSIFRKKHVPERELRVGELVTFLRKNGSPRG